MFKLNDIRKTYTGRKPQPIGKHKFFSVLVPFVEKDGEVYMLFEVRAKNMESQPGEICFPGGHVEEGEDPRDAALRETFEEIGIPRERIELIGPGDTLYGYANYTLYTYMGIIDYEDYQKAVLAPGEVDEIFLMPLKYFADNPPKRYRESIYTDIGEDFPYGLLGIDEDYEWRVGNWVIPIYEESDRVVWGLTARITENIIKVLSTKNTFK